MASIRQASYRASIGAIKRPVFGRMYPVVLVKPDGSSINIKYPEPIGVIQLPFDVSQLNEVEKKRRLLKRQMSGKSGQKKNNEEEEQIISRDVKFDPRKYINNKKK